MLISFTYHDVVPPGHNADSSGFAGVGAGSYKLTSQGLEQHLSVFRTLNSTLYASDFSAAALRILASQRQRAILLTFDDGGISYLETTADLLEGVGMRGLIFVPTDFVGKPGFLTPEQLRKLRRRGHGIGSHSASHPLRMATCSETQLRNEWRTSLRVLSDILGERVDIASVPGGQYRRKVALAAADCGIEVLFTSEPTARVSQIDRCSVLGRFSVRHSTSPGEVQALASAQLGAVLRQSLAWNAKKALKRITGRSWLTLRDKYFGRST